MKRLLLFLTIVVLCFAFSTSYSQLRLTGFLQSSGYGWENIQQNQQWDYYQALKLRVRDMNHQNLYLNTYLRGAYRGDPQDWDERVYNMYVNWNVKDDYRIRVGRQFLYNGVINGTMDGALLSGVFNDKLSAKVVVGTVAPFRRNFEVMDWDEGNALGGYLAYTYSGNHRLDISYFQKSRNEDQYWQQLGGAANGLLFDKLYYYARFDYNLLSEDYQTMRYRLMYRKAKWSLSAEFNSQRPRIFEDSFFNIFDVDAYNQLRTMASYQLGNYNLGVQYLHTAYKVSKYYILFKEQDDDRLIGTVSSQFGTIGVVYQTGFGGENVGYFGEIHYEVLPQLTARVFNSFYNYERAVTNISEDALSFSAGLRYRFRNLLDVDAELQQTQNNLFDNDVRGLVRITYLFDI